MKGFQLAGRMPKAAGVDWKVNISRHMNPPGNVLRLQSHVAVTAAVITLLNLRKVNHRVWFINLNLGLKLDLSPTT